MRLRAWLLLAAIILAVVGLSMMGMDAQATW